MATPTINLPYPNHKLWHDFRNTSISFDIFLVFPPGAGGNFLIPQLVGEQPLPRANLVFNEYSPRRPGVKYKFKFLRVTNVELEDITSENQLDIMYNQICDENLANQHYEVGSSHRIPILYMHIFNMVCKEMICITANDVGNDVKSLLAFIKNIMFTEFDTKPHQITHIISVLLNKIVNEEVELTQVIQSILPSGPTAISKTLLEYNKSPLSNTNNLIIWLYYFHLIENKIQSSQEQFSIFLSSYLKNMLIHDVNIQPTQQLGDLNNINIIYVDYLDLFFKQNMPAASALSKLAGSKLITDYTNRNIKLINELKKLLTPDLQLLIDNLLKKLPEIC